MKKSIHMITCAGLCAILAGCGQVDTGEVGIFTRWGEVISNKPEAEGIHFYKRTTARVDSKRTTERNEDIKVCIMLPPELVAQVDAAADGNRRSRTGEIQVRLEASFAAEKKEGGEK